MCPAGGVPPGLKAPGPGPGCLRPVCREDRAVSKLGTQAGRKASWCKISPESLTQSAPIPSAGGWPLCPEAKNTACCFRRKQKGVRMQKTSPTVRGEQAGSRQGGSQGHGHTAWAQPAGAVPPWTPYPPQRLEPPTQGLDAAELPGPRPASQEGRQPPLTYFPRTTGGLRTQHTKPVHLGGKRPEKAMPVRPHSTVHLGQEDGQWEADAWPGCRCREGRGPTAGTGFWQAPLLRPSYH